MASSPVLSSGTVVIFRGSGREALPLWADGEAGIIVKSVAGQSSELGTYYVINARGQVHILRMRRARAQDMSKYPLDDIASSIIFCMNSSYEDGIPVTVLSPLSSQ